MFSNPVVLSGIGGVLSQMARQMEAQELRRLLVRIDEKLDDVRRQLRDAVLAQLSAAAAEIDEAMLLRDGGDPTTIWTKVSGLSEGIKRVEESALLALDALSEKLAGMRKATEIKKAMRDVEQAVVIHLATLARCMELRDELWILELDNVMATNPDKLDGHRRQLEKARDSRREGILDRTAHIMTGLDTAGLAASEHIVLHPRAVGAVVSSVNSTAETVEIFHQPLGIHTQRTPLEVKRWPDALRDPSQRKTARKELFQKSLMSAGVAAAAASLGAVQRARRH